MMIQLSPTYPSDLEKQRHQKLFENAAFVKLMQERDLFMKYKARLDWLHSANKDSNGYEYGVCKVKFDADGKVVDFSWTLADHSNIDHEAWGKK